MRFDSEMADFNLKPGGAIHPGEILLSEFMESLGITAYRLAKDLHVSLPRVSDIVKAKGAITADTAVRLGRYFDMSSQFWMNLQTKAQEGQIEAEAERDC